MTSLAELVDISDADLGPLAEAASELENHTETVEMWEREAAEGEEEDPWVFAADNESPESFKAAFPPSTTEKAWISTEHKQRKAMVEEYHKKAGAEGATDKEKLAADWEATAKKSQESLTALLKQHHYGCGKWMIFSPPEKVDYVWAKVVDALWRGKLGHTAKVSGALTDTSKSHVICVYVDPFWEPREMERVLSNLRTECGIADAIKFKPDGITLLNIYKDNDHGIPHCFYGSSHGSLSLVAQTASTGRWCKNGANCKHLKQGRCSYLHKDEDFVKEVPKWRQVDEDGMTMQRPASRAPRAPREPRPEEKTQKKEKKAASAFAALMGVEDDDADAILEKKRKKREKAAAKKAAAEAATLAESAANFEALKSGLGQGNWADEDEDEDDELAPMASSAVVDDDDSDDEEEEEEEEEEEAEEEEASYTANYAAAPEPKKPAKDKTAEELEVEALLGALELKQEESKQGDGSMSKAAAKRAKKKAAEAAKKDEEAAPAPTENAAPQEGEGAESAAPKSADEIAKMMKARAEAAKAAKASKGTSVAAKLAAEEMKKREAAAGGKKKKAAPTYQVGGHSRGQKARGSDNKYQGE